MPSVPEPYRVRVVDPIRHTSRAQRERFLQEAEYNLYRIDSENVYVDLLTDSGTGAITVSQLAAMMRGDESYAGSASYRRLEAMAREVFGMEHIVPTHQGRAAERILMKCLTERGSVVPSNTHFETTRANCIDFGAVPVDLPSASFWEFETHHAFKGNMDCAALDELLSGADGPKVPFVLMTITNNMCGDQPVSMANLEEVQQISKRHGKPLYIDACRFAQNAWFIQRHEAGYAGTSIREIVRKMFLLADGFILSAKKDALAQMGGMLVTRSAVLAESAREQLVLAEGFVTYGGMNGRDMEMIAVGLSDGLDDEYLACRMETTQQLFDLLQQKSVPVLAPAGGHAVYINATQLMSHLKAEENPGQALAAEIYADSGVRTTRLVLEPTTGPRSGQHIEFVRLAIPSRVYSAAHLEYTAESVCRVACRREQISGLKLVSAPLLLGGFLARFEPSLY